MTILRVTSGSDVRIVLAITSEGAPVSLVGRTVEVFGAAPQIEGRVSATITDAAGGAFEVLVEGTAPIPVGTYGFRLQINGPGDSIGLPLMNLKVI